MMLFAATFEGMGLSFGAIFEWTLQEGRSHRPVPKETHWAARRQFSIGLLAYLVAIAVAFGSALAAIAIIGRVAVFYVFERIPAGGSADNSFE